MATKVFAELPNAINLIDRLSLPEIAAFLSRSRLFVGNDSGLMHLSAAAGAPTLGLFGPTNAAGICADRTAGRRAIWGGCGDGEHFGGGGGGCGRSAAGRGRVTARSLISRDRAPPVHQAVTATSRTNRGMRTLGHRRARCDGPPGGWATDRIRLGMRSPIRRRRRSLSGPSPCAPRASPVPPRAARRTSPAGAAGSDARRCPPGPALSARQPNRARRCRR